MPPELLRAVLTVAFGALAGGITNTVAVWMLFHPYEPPRIGRWRIRLLHGAIPKNQARLAEAVGRTVGNRLLTDEDLARTFATQEFREAFDVRVSSFLNEVLEKERPSLRETLPPEISRELDGLLQGLVDVGLERLDVYLHSTAFERAIADRSEDLVETLRNQPIGEILTPEREDLLAQTVDQWLDSVTDSAGFRRAVDESLENSARRFLRPGRTFEEVLPSGLVASLEKAVAAYLPLAIQRLGRLLEDPVARARFETTVHDLLQRFLHDLRFHQRVVARLIVTEGTVDRVLGTIEEEGAEHLSEMLRDPAVQDAMARGVNDAVVDFLQRPVTSVLGTPDDPNVREARETIAGWIVAGAREPAARRYLVEKMRAALDRMSTSTWGELFERVPPEQLADWIIQMTRSGAAHRLYAEAGQTVTRSLLDHPLGRPADWLPPATPSRLEEAVSDPLWHWLQGQVPEVVRRIDVARRVETKVREYPTARLEELVRRVTSRELRLIVRLGYVLGAVIGCVLVVVNALLG